MTPSGARSSSIPRHYHRLARLERFTVTDAVHVKLKLQALDAALSNLNLDRNGQVDMKSAINACQSRPFHEAVYVDGSEEFYLLVKSLSRPDLIPNVYVNAYSSVLHGRPYLNEYKVSDFRKGVDPTFSEIRPLLAQIDALCETHLDSAFNELETRGKYLNRPSDLRLLTYSHLLPREAHLALIYQPHREHKTPRIRLDVLRTNKQIHDEVVEYFYEKRTLFLVAARDKASQTLSNNYLSRFYDMVAMMNPRTRQLFGKLEIQVSYLSGQTTTMKRYPSISFVADPMRDLFALLPKVQTLVIAFGPTPFIAGENWGIIREKLETVYWLIDCVPVSIDVRWDLSRAFTSRFKVDEGPLRRIVAKRGTVHMGESVSSKLASQRRSLLHERP
ncbi:hypothetical protein LEMA_P030700.1 [Plenodomus lingam JN3]|uniref:Uncharacterized protein n=1 Tax=Leptosphaeria maculans (strain JN3 / isolate v23.1.3 / race Av1-4-5-6-7-8) TaxID=985895 RepID=E4ZWE2_LEPMJ|nr:hypothetical protein LEMA_P030700.1 [Plenodomus lingam JN3]CBX95918.1 hypothetical protein LEMA_P030700.1 [Plenodomus lingam JN3]